MNMPNRSLEITHEAAPFFKEGGQKIAYKKAQLFVRPEDTAQGIYFLEEGQVLVYMTRANGTEQIVGVWEKGTIFGKVGSVMPQRFTPVNMEALTDCTVYRINQKQFLKLIDTNKAVNDSYLKQTLFNNIYAMSQIFVLGEKNIYTRVIAQILLLSDYYGDVNGEECTLRIFLTQEQLANMVCISREYLSKMLTKIKKKKIITLNKLGFIQIPKLSLLQREMEEGK